MRNSLSWAALWVLLAYAGCSSHRALSTADAGHDLAPLPVDLAPAAADLGGSCALASANSSVVYGGKALSYAWFANRECDSFSQVIVILGTTSGAPYPDESTEPKAMFSLVRPQQLGTQTIDVTTDIGASTTLSATLELTDFTADPVQNAVVSVAGRLQAADGSWQGSFTAARCLDFESACI